ncbi:rhodanese-like domain-containing protein [Thioalbus denitrificans]|uniref:Rhodanese-related sulfurtransferase n=1 Tax=Thioalbus denitrificans TaxID=547122 RepID=A0A369C375_9GAMM|nr:rhodanese-like domain-containing protein [Thioalbus denitrificans]RCX28440.1 rhodanese-related sulfurtransferase [Thioalbus denitrificans]
MNMKNIFIAVAGIVSVSLASPAAADEIGDGNRYELDRYYHSEISAAEAYQDMMRNEAVLIDVRRLREYAAGHPERAYNVPYPHIVGSNDQSALTFYWEVYDIVNGRTDTPIMTLCRTGHRSVLAANILSDPDSHPDTQGLEPFTNVRNIWEGFVGQYKYAYAGGNILLDPNPIPLDLNNNGVMDSDTADVYSHTSDANPDKDGWRNFQHLPWTSKIRKPLAYLQDELMYEGFIEY